MVGLLLRQPAQMRLGPMLASTVDPSVAQQKRQQLLVLAAKILRCSRVRPDKIADRFVHRSGTQTGVRSPARNSRASVTASRRLVLTRSPGRFGTNEGATTMQS